MESKMYKIYARNDERIQLKVYPGHFITPQSHITHYLDMSTMKSRSAEAKRIAQELARVYTIATPVDTIVCLDGTEVVGAYLAEELTKVGVLNYNAHQTMYITSPEYSMGHVLFRDNVQIMIKGKNCLVLNGSITTGQSLAKVLKTINYYGGKISGVAAIFSEVDKVAGLPIISLFQHKDIPDYGTFSPNDCPMCERQQKMDAIVNGFGYSKIDKGNPFF